MERAANGGTGLQGAEHVNGGNGVAFASSGETSGVMTASPKKLNQLRTSVAELNKQYVEIESRGALSRPLRDIIQSLVHLH